MRSSFPVFNLKKVLEGLLKSWTPSHLKSSNPDALPPTPF